MIGHVTQKTKEMEGIQICEIVPFREIDLGMSIPQQCYRLDLTWYYTPTWLLLNIGVL